VEDEELTNTEVPEAAPAEAKLDQTIVASEDPVVIAGGNAEEEFDRCDVNKNGVLEGEEVLPLAEWVWARLHPGQKPTGHDIRQTAAEVMHCSDLDLDGRLQIHEFVDYFNKKQDESAKALVQEGQGGIEAGTEDPEEEGLSAAAKDALTLAHSAATSAPVEAPPRQHAGGHPHQTVTRATPTRAGVVTQRIEAKSGTSKLLMGSKGFLQPTVSRSREEERPAEREPYEIRPAKANSLAAATSCRQGPIYSTTSAHASRRSQSPTLVYPEYPEENNLKAARGRALSPAQRIRSMSPPAEAAATRHNLCLSDADEAAIATGRYSLGTRRGSPRRVPSPNSRIHSPASERMNDARFEAAMAASWHGRRFGPAVCPAAVPLPPMPPPPSQLFLGSPLAGFY